MSRQRALAWMAGLCLAIVALFAPSFISLVVTAALAQETNAGEAEPTGLAVVALHCAEAPAAAALESFFASGAPPAGCAPAVGVAVTIEENGDPVSGSPFATDVSGSFVVPVGLGSAVVARENPDSLPEGYEPLTGEADGVPYANPVRLDPAVAGAAVLFVNVPASVAEVDQEAIAAEANEPTELVEAEPAEANILESTANRTGCDLAYHSERSPTVPLDSGALVADTDGVGFDAGSSTVRSDARLEFAASGGSFLGAHSGSGDLAVTRNSVRSGFGVWSRISRGRTDWREHRDRDHDGDGPWFWPGRVGIGNLAGSGSLVRIGNGVWLLPFDRDRSHDWLWRSDRDHDDTWHSHGKGIWVWSGTVAASGNGNLAVSGSSVRIGDGPWFLSFDRNHDNDWRWPARDRMNGWFPRGHGFWGWPGRVAIGNVAAARSGGNVAVVGSFVRLGQGLWLLPSGRSGSGLWIWNGAIARSSSGSLAISGSSVRIGTGLWLLPAKHEDGHDWLRHDRDDRANSVEREALASDEVFAAPSSPGKIEQSSGGEQTAPTIDDGIAAAAPADAIQAPSDDAGQPPLEAAEPASDGGVAAPLDAAAAPEVDSGYVASESVAPTVEPAPDAGAVDPSYVAVEPASVAPDPGYGEPAAAPVVEPVYAEPVVEPSVDPGSVAPEPIFGEPSFENGDSGFADPVTVAAEPVVEAGVADPGNFEPDAGFGDPGVDGGFVAPEPGNGGPEFFAPDPVIVDSAGGGSGFGDGSNAMPDPGFSDVGNAGFGNGEPIIVDQPNVTPDGDGGRGEQRQEEE